MAATIFSRIPCRTTLPILVWLATGLLAIGAICSAAPSAHAAAKRSQIVAGWIENILITPGNLPVKAKLDTGARTSSIDAPHFETFEKDGKPWVRFGFSTNENKSVKIERPIKRTARIKDLTGPDQIRNVIEIGVCLDKKYTITEVTLFDRTGFNYRLLLGRSFMKKAGILVNPNTTYLTNPSCPKVTKP